MSNKKKILEMKKCSMKDATKTDKILEKCLRLY